MKFIKFAMVAALLPLLAACASGPDIAMTKSMPSKGNDFQKALQMEYARVAQFEAKEYDMDAAKMFNDKAVAAAQGKAVEPSKITGIKGDVKYELEAARQALRAVILSDSVKYAPEAAAAAQASFDCWVHEAQEGDTVEESHGCIEDFNKALKRAEGAHAPMQAAAPAPKPAMKPIPGPFTVYFDFDSFAITPAAKAIIDEAAKAGMAASVTGVKVTGHTDLSGNKDYNVGLSRARAVAVGNALMEAGIARKMVSRKYDGEAAPAVMTADGVKNARNRRVTISFTR